VRSWRQEVMAPDAYETCTQDSIVFIVLLLVWNALVRVCVRACNWHLNKEALCDHDFSNWSSIFPYITVFKTAFQEFSLLFRHKKQSTVVFNSKHLCVFLRSLNLYRENKMQLYLKVQFVPRSKHSPSRLLKPIISGNRREQLLIFFP
jgi:hypothetical protein